MYGRAASVVALSLCAVSLFDGFADASVRYVRPSAPAGGDGLSWATAYNDLAPALAAAHANTTITELWVAVGTYLPTQIFEGDPRNKSFLLRKDLAILGGFNGSETLAAERDPVTNICTLSGDIGAPGDASDNSYHVVRTLSSSSISGLTAVLDGFVITGANANVNFNNVGGALLADGLCTLRRCRLVGNVASQRGAGVYTQVPLVFEGCDFEQNQNAGVGAAAVQFEGNGGTLTFTECAFRLNSGNAGAVRCQGAVFTDCVFEDNVGTGPGAIAWYGNNAQNLTLRGCTFRSNVASFNAGAILAISAGSLKVIDSVFEANSATTDGAGAIFRQQWNLSDVVVNTQFLGNIGVGSNGGGAIRDGEIVFQNCVFSGNKALVGGAIASQSTQPIVNCTFAGNSATNGGAAIYAVGKNIKLSNSILWANDVGGVVTQATQLVCGTSPVIQYSTVQGWTGAFGGAGNGGADPILYLPLGVDGILGTLDDDLRIGPGSPAIDSGNAGQVAADVGDVDLDGNVAEATPFDVAGTARFVDDPSTPNAGAGSPAFVDRGAHEFDEAEFDGTVTWIGPKNGSWFVAANWSNGVVPNARTELVVAGSVLVDAAGAVAGSLTVASGGGLSIGAGGIAATSISVESGGTLALIDAAASIACDVLSVSSGSTIDWAAGTVRVSALLESSTTFGVGCAGSGTLEIVDATIDVPLLEVCNGAVVRGAGTILGGVSNDGIVEPGTVDGAGSVLDVLNAYTQSARGTLRYPLVGFLASSTRIELHAATMSLAGTFEAFETGEAIPEIFAHQRAYSANAVVGAFTTVSLPSAPTPFLYELVAASDGGSVRSRINASAPRLYVRSDAAPGGDGQSWSSATSSLRGALRAAAFLNGADRGIADIWVAAGTYAPHDDGASTENSFDLASGVAVYGGFEGNESSLEERDPNSHVTTLTGDALGNDDPSPRFPGFDPSRDDNSSNVVKAIGTGVGTSLDGCTVRGGYYGLWGAAIRVLDGSLAVRGCRITENVGTAAGIAARGTSALEVDDCEFVGNDGYSGVDLYVLDVSTLQLKDSEFNGAAGVEEQAPALAFVGANVPEAVISNCTFLGGPKAGGLRVDGGATIRDSYFGPSAGQSLITGPNDVLLESTTIANDSGPCIYLGQGGSLKMHTCSLRGWRTTSGGGALWADEGSELLAVNCAFSASSAPVGGAIFVDGASCVFEGCLFLGNDATIEGGAIELDNGELTLRFCTVFANEAPIGAGIYVPNDSGDQLVIENSIVWGNLNDGVASLDSQIYAGPLEEPAISVSNSIVQFIPRFLWGRGNSAKDPGFTDPLGVDLAFGTGDEDCTPTSTSPAVNASAVSSLPLDTLDVDDDDDTLEPLPLDANGNARVYGGLVDRGALEWRIAADLNSDGVVDGADLAIILGAWGTSDADLDGDGTTNGADLALVLGSWTSP